MKRFKVQGMLGAELRICRLLALVALVSVASASVLSARAESTSWLQWQRLEGIVDVGGPRDDGSLVTMANGRLFLVSPNGVTSPFASGLGGYAGPSDAEPYFVVAPALPPAADCGFTPGDTFILDLGDPAGITRVDAGGQAARFATIPDVSSLGGIAFDTVGRFSYALLATGEYLGQTRVVAIDCQGGVRTITSSAPPVEGGLAVAPASFGAFGGDLIAPDELTGQIWAIGPEGGSRLVTTPDLPIGGDTGVESLGFVPPGFQSGGFAYLADRGTTDNPFPGSDSLLRLSAQALSAAGVADGDLLVATEGHGLTVAIHCDAICTTVFVASQPGGHIEGHIVFVPGR